MRLIGIFGGTFDPIHYGHLRMAVYRWHALDLAEVRFIPASDPPHRGQTFAPAALRMDMVRAATAHEPGFTVDDRELNRDVLSYAGLIRDSLRKEHDDTPMGLIVGMDAFLGLTSWHRWEAILNLAHIIVAHRPGWKTPDTGVLGELIATHGTHRVEDLHDARHGRIHIHAVTQLEIASTEIRALVAAGRDPRFLMPDPVRDIIANSGCYAGET